jgi:hypothetical protein
MHHAAAQHFQPFINLASAGGLLLIRTVPPLRRRLRSGTLQLGSVVGNTTVNGGLQPGSSPGLLSFSNNLTLGGTAVTTMEINGADRGTTFDAVNVGSLLTYDGTLSLSLGTTFAEGNYSFDLFDFSGGQTGSFDAVELGGLYSGSLVNNGSGVWGLASGNETWTFTQGSGALELGVVPEPSTYALLALSAAGVLGFWRISKRAGNRAPRPGDLR